MSEEQYNTLQENAGDYTTKEQLEGLGITPLGTTEATNPDGITVVEELEEGYYWFVENGSKAITASHAVPFGLELPITNQDGRGYMEEVHVWSKNELEETPKIDKTVSDLENKSDSFDIGENFDWFVQTDVPKGIGEYKLYSITDELDPALDFDGQSVEVTYNDVTLQKDTDYTLTYESHVIKVELTQAGLEKLDANYNAAHKLVTKITTQINESATLGLEIKNGGTLNFDNGHGQVTTPGGDTPPPEVTEQPYVYTGGKKFEKVDNNGEKLRFADFVIKNQEGKFLKQTDGKVEWVDDQSEATTITSADDGTFEVKGLSYGEKGDGNQGFREYFLIETKAPEGYALPTNSETTFVVNASSYYSDPSNLSPAIPQDIVNKKVTIPNTGGIVTFLFTVVGLLFILTAFTILRRKSKEA